MNCVSIIAHASPPMTGSPWALSPSDRVLYLARYASAIAACRWRRAFAITDVLNASTGQAYAAALAQLAAIPK